MTTKMNLALVSTTLRRAAIIAALAAGPVAAQRGAVVPNQRELRLAAPVVAGAGPTGLRAGPTPTSIRLTWQCPQGASGYEVFATPAGGALMKLTQGPITNPCYQDLTLAIARDPRFPAPTEPVYITSFTHVGLAPAADFVYIVRALYPDGYGDSQPLVAQTSVWPAPTGLIAIPSGLDLALTWNAVPGATGYSLTRESSSGGWKALTPNACQTQTTYRDLAIAPGAYTYRIQSCPNSASAVIPVRIGTVGYDMAVVGLNPALGSSSFGPTMAVTLRNEGDQVVQQASVLCTFGPVTLRSLSGGPTYHPGLEAGFTVFTDAGVGSLYFDLGPGSHGGTCAVKMVQPSNAQDADPADDSKLVTLLLPPTNPPDLRLLAMAREDCNGLLARQMKVGGDACIRLDYRFDNQTGPTLLMSEWTIECTTGGVTVRAPGAPRLFTSGNHTGVLHAMGFTGPGIAAAGTKSVTCRLDPDGRIAESNESNNVMTTTLVLP